MPAEGQGVHELLHALAEQSSHLVRQEIDLARSELKEKAKPIAASAAALGAAAVLGAGAFGAATGCAIIALSMAIPGWAAAAIVTAGYALAALALFGLGIRQMQQTMRSLAPQTTQTIKDDIAWVKTHLRSRKK
jgi:predicted phage tail protein